MKINKPMKTISVRSFFNLLKSIKENGNVKYIEPNIDLRDYSIFNLHIQKWGGEEFDMDFRDFWDMENPPYKTMYDYIYDILCKKKDE